jgi:hypothetical protein
MGAANIHRNRRQIFVALNRLQDGSCRRSLGHRHNCVHSLFEVPWQVAHEQVRARLRQIDGARLRFASINVVSVADLHDARTVFLDAARGVDGVLSWIQFALKTSRSCSMLPLFVIVIAY